MSNILFSKVNASDSYSFLKTGEKDPNAVKGIVGFVGRDDADYTKYGYLIVDGVQYGPSYSQVNNAAKTYADTAYNDACSYAFDSYTLACSYASFAASQAGPKVSIDSSKNSLVADGTGAKYTLKISADGKLSLDKYVAATLAASNSGVNTTSTSGSPSGLIGTTYTTSTLYASKTVNAEETKITYVITNPTNQEVAITGIYDNTTNTYLDGGNVTITDGVAYIDDKAVDYITDDNLEHTFTVASASSLWAAGTASASASAEGTFTWGGEKSVRATLGTVTITVYMHEKNATELVSSTIEIKPGSTTAATITKANWYKADAQITTDNYSSATATLCTYPTKTGLTAGTTMSWLAGNTPSVAYPTAWGTLKLQNLGVTDDSFLSSSITINGAPYTVLTKKAAIDGDASWTVAW